jgi:hypothetical protein
MVSAFGAGTWDASCALPRGDDGNTLRSILNKTIAVDGRLHPAAPHQRDAAGLRQPLAGYFDTLPVSVLAVVAVIAAGLLLVGPRRRW